MRERSWTFGVVSFLTVVALGSSACTTAAPPPPTAAPAAPTTAAAPKPTTAPAAAASAAPAAAASAAPAAKPSAAPAAAPSAVAAASPSAVASAANPAAAHALLPKPEQTTLKLGNAAHEADSFAPELANQLGTYKDLGFTDVQSTYFDGDAKGRQALLAGQIDVLSGGPGSSIESQTTDTPFVAIGTFILHPTDDLVSIPSVKTVADLKGKQVAVSSFGGDSHASVLLSLKALGLSTSDVTIVPIGGQNARIAALTAGSVAAAPIDDTLEDRMKAQGLNILVRLADAPVTLARESLMVRKDFAQKNPNTVLDILAASLEAEQDIYTMTDKAVDGFAEWTQAQNKDDANKEIHDYLPVGNRTMRFSSDGFDNLKEVMVAAAPELKDVDVKQAYTSEYLDKLSSLGFDKLVGVPQ
jgi:sulfonate transport system substrate-binding protein